ncbi:MAG: pyridoxamine 5'-phosphate oxidase family protein [Dehalococcoidia bacterium]|jgi:hypothetical protein|nr:pyridoxamine 5'-phosphate oxidase family protein [Dehalococcoidia bacterium]
MHGQPKELTKEEMVYLLRKAKYGRLGLSFENEPYTVPVSHVYNGDRIWFHIARGGKTTTYLQANPLICFQVDELTYRGWGSVICYGKVTLSEDVAAKRQYAKLSTGSDPSDEELQQMAVYICTLAIDEMTGRKSPGYVVSGGETAAPPAVSKPTASASKSWRSAGNSLRKPAKPLTGHVRATSE